MASRSFSGCLTPEQLSALGLSEGDIVSARCSEANGCERDATDLLGEYGLYLPQNVYLPGDRALFVEDGGLRLRVKKKLGFRQTLSMQFTPGAINTSVSAVGLSQSLVLSFTPGEVAPPPPWTPDSLVDLTLWLDASDPSTVLNAGGTSASGGEKVATWVDKSGNSRSAVQSSDASRPLVVSGGLNGLQVVGFNGSGQILDTPSMFMGNTAIIVAQRSNVAQPVGEHPYGSGISRGLWGTYGPGYSTHLNYRIDGVALPSGADPDAAVGSPKLVSGLNRTNSISYVLSLGSGFPAFQPLNGFIAEVVIVDSAVSDSDRQKIEGYLAHKWGLAGNLPVDHPYKTSAPTL